MDLYNYSPQELFAADAPMEKVPRVIIAPHRYIQGNGVLDNLGRYISTLNSKRPALFITKGGEKRFGKRVRQAIQSCGSEPMTLYFEGECSFPEIQRHVDDLKDKPIDLLVVVGGGKCLDAGKCVAHCKSVPMIICPTLASTDAPCSAVSVMYNPDGTFQQPWFFPESPAYVIVDTGIIARAPVRHLIAGMGDSMATYYEAKTCFLNPQARSMVGARPTATALAIAELGAKLLFEYGEKAVEATKQAQVNQALENVVEANILISGLGFESGGLAGSHGIAQVFPIIPSIHQEYLHGEMVAFGVMAHQCLEANSTEAKRVGEFFAKVGLPVHLGQLSLEPSKHAHEIDLIINKAMDVHFLHYEPFEVTHEKVRQAIFQADQLGKDISKKIGDSAYKALHY
jgi:glycerol dehydrogenase